LPHKIKGAIWKKDIGKKKMKKSRSEIDGKEFGEKILTRTSKLILQIQNIPFRDGT